MITEQQEEILNFIEKFASDKLDAMDAVKGSKKYSLFFEYEVIKELYDSIYLFLIKKEETNV